MSPQRVLSVGQCAYDHGRIRQHLSQALGVDVEGEATLKEALARLRRDRFDLVLVNRVGDSDGASGLEFIRALKTDADLAGIPVMLVSNFADAQAEAIGLGALPGFGKSELANRDTSERIRAALGGGADRP